MNDRVVRVSDPQMAADMAERLLQLDRYLRETLPDPMEAVSTCALWISHVHRHCGERGQPLIEDMLQNYLSDMRARRDSWQNSRT